MASDLSRLLAVAAIVAASALTNARVRADCLIPEPTLLWSYPAEGATEVPTRPVFWVLTNVATFGLRPEAALNGTPVPGAPEVGARTSGDLHEQVRFDPGELRPNTSYVLSLSFPKAGDWAASTIDIHFRTGRASLAPDKKSPTQVPRSEDAPAEAMTSHVCREVIASQGCFDTVEARPLLLYTLSMPPSAAIAWLLSNGQEDGSQLWPAECGSPALLMRKGTPNDCITIEAILPGGAVQKGAQHCPGGKQVATAKQARASNPAAAVGISPRKATPVPVPEAPKAQAARAPANEAEAQPAPAAEKPATGYGCSVPGGPSMPSLAAILVSALALLWGRRRRRT